MNQPTKTDKQRKQAEEQIFYNLMKIVQEFPQYSMSQHLAHILRSKGKAEPFYFWNNDTLLKHFEDYRDELNEELASRVTTDLPNLM